MYIWVVVISGALGMAFSAGLAYATLGKDVSSNTQNIQKIELRGDLLDDLVVGIRVERGELTGKIDALAERISSMARILERHYESHANPNKGHKHGKTKGQNFEGSRRAVANIGPVQS